MWHSCSARGSWSLTDWRQLILNFKNHSFPNILQQTDDLVVAEFGQVDPIHCFDVVPHIQLITSAKQRMSLQWTHPLKRPVWLYFSLSLHEWACKPRRLTQQKSPPPRIWLAPKNGVITLPIKVWFSGGRLSRSWTHQDFFFFFLFILSHFCCLSFGHLIAFSIFIGVCWRLRKGSAYFAIYCLQQIKKSTSIGEEITMKVLGFSNILFSLH